MDMERMAAGVDFRRRGVRETSERLLARAEFLPDEDRVLLESVYRDGRNFHELAALAGVSPRSMGRRVKRLVNRVRSPEFAFVAGRLTSFTRTRRRVATSCVLHGRSLRRAAEELGLSLHTVRRHHDALMAQCDLVRG